MTLPEGLTIDEVLAAAQSDDCLGFCLNCGASRDGCEPDAEHYHCNDCGADEVYGAEQIIIGVA